MKHSGKAIRAGLKLIFWTLVLLGAIIAAGFLAIIVGGFIVTIATSLITVWVLFALFTLYFFRDPNPLVPTAPNVVVAPAHGKVDVIDEVTELEFMGGNCRRISMFLSVVNVHVQNAPVGGKIAYLRHHPGEFLNAIKTESAAHNENLLLGIESHERPGEKVGVRLIAGMIARRIVPWVAVGDELARGERISLIQFGSRVDLYLPPAAIIKVQLGDKVVGGETVVATFD
ncbi:MAG: phosphatidylserine decarboxylase family protein [Verrucomicrobia bacterium]|nr:phosphatidylserine decarboxylase family protein [Verrucomicrobiota bacterium]